MKDVELYTYELINHRFCVIGLLNDQQIVLDDITFATAGQAQNYIYDNHVKLSKKVLERYKAIYGPIPSSKNIKTENESPKKITSSKKTTKKKTAKKKVRIKRKSQNGKFTIRQLIAVVLAFSMLAVIPFVGWLLSHISKKNKNYVPAKNDDVLNLITDAPVDTLSPVVSEIPTEIVTIEPTVEPTIEPVLVTVDNISVMANNIFNQYSDFQNSTDIIVNKQLVRYQLTEADLMDAIICLNCDSLEENSYNTFSQLRTGRDINSMIYNYQCVMTLITQLNINRFRATGSIEGLMPLSSLVIDEQSRNEAQEFEQDCLDIWLASLNYDPWIQSNNGPVCARIQSMVDDLTCKISSNTVAMNGITSFHYSALGNAFVSMLGNGQADSLKYWCDVLEDTNDNVMKDTLLLDANQSYIEGCSAIQSGYTRKRIRNV